MAQGISCIMLQEQFVVGSVIFIGFVDNTKDIDYN